MLDRKYIIQNQELVQQNCDRRGVTVDLPRIAELERCRLEKLQLSERLNQQANETSKGIGKAKDDAERQAMMDKGRQLREQKEAAQREQDQLDAEIIELQSVIPNMTHPDVPDGGDAQFSPRLGLALRAVGSPVRLRAAAASLIRPAMRPRASCSRTPSRPRRSPGRASARS